MGTQLTKDHHLLTRNLKLNGNYISNDGGDEGIRITDAGNVGIGVSDPDTPLEVLNTATQLKLSYDGDSFTTIGVADASHTTIATGESGNLTLDSAGDITLDPTGVVLIDKNYSNTTAAAIKALHVDLDRTGTVSTGIDTSIGIDLDVTHTGASGGTIISTGIDLDVIGDGEVDLAYGIDINVSGSNICNGIGIINKDGGTDFINRSSEGGSVDYFTLNTIEDGETTLTTVESGGGSTAHLNMVADGNFTVDAAGTIIFKSSGTTTFDRDISLAGGKVIYFDSAATKIGSNDDDPEDMVIEADQDILMSPDASLVVDAGGGITLDSATGVFEMHGAGTTAKFADMYAGMVLGCTHVFGSGTGGQFQAVTTAWESLLWDTDKYALVTFVVPPSNKVKISVHLPYNQLSGNFLYLGLATDSSATTLNAKYDNKVWDVDETDIVSISYSWVVDGSDHSWSAGETKTLYIMAYATGNIRLYTGGTNANYFGGVIVEAIALPATIGDGSEP